jgi:hypothetical protein
LNREKLETMSQANDDDFDLVDRIFDYLLLEIPGFADGVQSAKLAELKNAVRTEFKGIGSASLPGRVSTS